MPIQQQIQDYISNQAEPKRCDMQALHNTILALMPDCRLWFLDGKDEHGKIVSNPSIGYGFQTLEYANGKSRDFYQIGLSANTVGFSIYILGLKKKNDLAERFGKDIGKASITAYCIKFKSIQHINIEVLK